MVKLLSELLPGETGTVAKIHGNGPIQRRIIDMGVVIGTKVEVQKYAPLGDPMEVKVKGFNLSLRKGEAKNIEINVN
ncbi:MULTISPECIES: FeoA family protein [Sporomusa]|jgi:ferrous iron transport protein A|uniref:Ferrous iron transport protein A n=2 Tax=Sporomusa TaxID=2375 RepID=A0ABM9W6M2_9FIRM|nr:MULTISPECIES: FeoA family protein [Sporomusa]MCM0758173.1 ferrous iron transport protein A [Sporomusa sphaeroides DSM 2875]OLS54569.1 ferrous iron transport protein A [Sporomusa sphaeroides DSM 2875]CVK20801.1 ferrous iron transport protein A [Sporomusa sphaeroides DSM 2875]SCM83122.1 Fe2+ transport system protein A [uncultured Sporomusa sp.]HML32841.1 FeoA family protein [Sporomusa sphaeroides]